MHLKRQKVPKSWPTKRKGTAYVVKANSNLKKSIPALVVLRDLIEVAKNRKEVKKAIFEKNILVNEKLLTDEKNSLALFDTLTIVPSKKYYKITLSEKGRFEAEEIKASEAKYKIAKIVDKKILKGKKIQLNLSDGKNYLDEIKCQTNDSVLINLKDKKIEKVVPFKVGSNVFIFAGKHTGKVGKIEKIDDKTKMGEVDFGKGKINVLIKQVMAIE